MRALLYHFHFISIAIPLISYSQLSFQHIIVEPCSYDRTCVTIRTPSHHESPIAQCYSVQLLSGRLWVRLPLGTEFIDLKTFRHFLIINFLSEFPDTLSGVSSFEELYIKSKFLKLAQYRKILISLYFEQSMNFLRSCYLNACKTPWSFFWT